MFLYTNQPIDFDIVKDKVDLSKSELYADKEFDGFKNAYDFLFNQLDSKDWIWCYGRCYMDDCKIVGSDKNKYQKPYKTWILDVPDKHIVCIDRDIWDNAINGFYCTEEIFTMAERLQLGKDYDKFIDEVDNTIKRLIPASATYKGLIKKDKKTWKKDSDDFLVPSPIKKNWIQRVYNVQLENRS